MLLMRRGIGQMISIQPSPDIDPTTPVGELFAKPVEVMLIQASGDQARFAIYADPGWLVVEEELLRSR
ncbi:MAG: hypothetical protein M0R77_14640 [Gammaproteobacteria bacterium]|nr:hypothetical protein [Gammaproteobacteria bacterium]